MNIKTLLLAAAVAGLAAPAMAQTSGDWTMPRAGDWIVTGRVTDVAPTTDDAIITAAGADSGLHGDVSDSIMPTLGFTYFLTDVAVHKTWVLPPVVTLQYRPLTQGNISPYVGAGVNAMVFYGGDDKNGFEVDLDDGFGYALQAGADIGLRGPWSVNVDVKRVWFNTDADVNNGALAADVDLDPWVVSVGVGRRF